MKILKLGKPAGDEKFTATCNGCGTKVEFLKSETKYVNDPRDGDYWEIQCPVCPRRITKACPPVYYP